MKLGKWLFASATAASVAFAGFVSATAPAQAYTRKSADLAPKCVIGVSYPASMTAKVRETIAVCTQLLAMRAPDLPDQFRPGALEARGISYSKLGQYGKAIADLSAAIRLDPRKARFRYNRGLAYKESNQFGPALADFNEAIRLDRRYGLAFLMRGEVHERLGNSGAAIADYRAALRFPRTGPRAAASLKRLRGGS